VLAVVAVTDAADRRRRAVTVAAAAGASGLTARHPGGASPRGLLLRHRGPADDELARTARLLTRPAARARRLPAWAAVAGGVAAPWLAVVMLTAGHHLDRPPPRCAPSPGRGAAAELLERWRFFTAVAPARMPGRLP
jgi:hypothetical protein